MAGDLVAETIDQGDLDKLKIAGGVVTQSIFHADRAWATYNNNFKNRCKNGVQNRVNLPAHCYIEFNAFNVAKADEGAMYSILQKFHRYTMIVRQHPGLGQWDSENKLSVFRTALVTANIRLEFYKIGKKPVLKLGAPFSGYARHNE